MDIFKIIGIGIVGAITVLLVKNTNKQFAPLIVLGVGIVILIITVNALSQVMLGFQGIVDKTGIDSALYSSLLKIIGIGYITEYSASICNDLDCTSIGKKLGFAGKIAIFILALPIVNSLIECFITLVG